MRLMPRGLGRGRRSARSARASDIALAPESWGVSELRGWGAQPDPERVLGDIASLGEGAIEAGPSGFLPDRSEATRSLLKRHRLRVVAGPVRAVLHHHDLRGQELAHVDGHAAWLAAIGAETLVLSLIGSRSDGDPDVELSSTGWAHLLSAIGSVQHLCTTRGLRLAVQPRYGSTIQSPADIERLLVGSEVGVCVDVGHLAVVGADAVEVVELAAGRIDHVHVSDVDRTVAESVRDRRVDYATAVSRGLFKPLGKGDAGVGEVVEALQRSGYRGWYAIAVERRRESVADDVSADVKASVAYLRRLIPAQRSR